MLREQAEELTRIVIWYKYTRDGECVYWNLHWPYSVDKMVFVSIRNENSMFLKNKENLYLYFYQPFSWRLQFSFNLLILIHPYLHSEVNTLHSLTFWF